ncbi:unnamed protein product [Adineta steineri]|uniref:NHL repeat containing protein n=1 Tax=Adineta steineri TaxID=433720 RepID=A0A815VVR4_9BILA|nr:unnamed protein product [Adineta steineri]CAF1537944.1 unnamed protein product [Adineta steineri]
MRRSTDSQRNYILSNQHNPVTFRHDDSFVDKQLDEIINGHGQLQQTIIQQKQNSHNSSLTEQINQWETNSVHQIQQTAEECRKTLIKLTQTLIDDVEKKFIKLSEKLKEIREEDECNEIDLNNSQLKLTQITEEFLQSSNISIKEDSQEFIKRISVISSFDSYQSNHPTTSTATILKDSITTSYKNYFPISIPAIPWNPITPLYKMLTQFQPAIKQKIFIDNDKSIYIADYENHRIVKWKLNSNTGQIIAGGNQNNPLNYPRDIIFDSENNSLIISDKGNKRVIRYFDQNQTDQQILVSNIDCFGITIDQNGFIYVSDFENHEVRRWKQGDVIGELVVGGNGKGDHLNQLNGPSFIFIDKDYSLYISDRENHRAVKWEKDAKEGIIVAGGNGNGNQSDQLNGPAGLSFDNEANLYVVDQGNHRIQKYEKTLN